MNVFTSGNDGRMASSYVRVFRISGMGAREKERITRRAEGEIETARAKARKIVEDVKARGDRALLDYTEKFDGVKLRSSKLRVSARETRNAYSRIDVGLLRALRRAARNIRRFHQKQVPREYWIEVEKGVRVGRRAVPVDVAGVYVPGGKARYPSVILMLAIPARIAGVRRIIACTPPRENGKVDEATLVAADIAGVDEVYRVGGAQAIAAMAYGTKTIPRADVIAGPGNPYVCAAQRMLRDVARIDFPPGPSEGMVLADGRANPLFVAADVLSEAEHGSDSAGILVTDSEELARSVGKRLEKMMRELPEPRGEYVRETMRKYGALLIADNFEEAVDFVNEYAPEHLVLNVKRPRAVLKKIRSAGTVCLGAYSPITLGNFIAGPNAILPTGGFARRFSGVSVDTFLKRQTVERASRRGLGRVARDVVAMCGYEGFPAHARSIEVRL
ncbi:MAG: histidinol dehydrogenase [Candidatus Micrarchaeota archaeon]